MQPFKNIATIDFETYYDTEYTLKKLTTTMYVRDKLFFVHGVGVKINDQPTEWVTTNIKEYFQNIDWSTTAFLAHNTAFDGFILTEHFNVTPCYWLDTLSMSRVLLSHDVSNHLDTVANYLGLGRKIPNILASTMGKRNLTKEELEQLGTYCIQDTELCYAIYQTLNPTLPKKERDLIDLTIRLFTEPIIETDKDLVNEYKQDFETQRTELLNKASKIIGSATNEETATILRSPNKFVAELKKHCEHIPTKISPRTGKVTYALSKDDISFMELRSRSDSLRGLIDARLAATSNISITRADRILAHSTNRPLPILLNYGKAHTYRWTGGDKINPQNFPRGSKLRRSLRAPEGYRVIVVDSSQIEARTTAWLAGQHDLLDDFKAFDSGTDLDPYCKQAALIYNRRITPDDKQERFVGKVAILGLGYRMGAPRFQYTLACGAMGPSVYIDIEAAKRAVQTYRNKNHMIVNLWEFMRKAIGFMINGTTYKYKVIAFDHETCLLPNGLSLWYPHLDYENYECTYASGKNKRSKLYDGLLTENVVQALARIIVAEQMLKIAERYRIVTMSHDETVYLAHWREAQKALDFGLEQLRTPLDWCLDLPLNAEGGYDVCYSK